ncbi:MAG: hypothetical protein ACYC6Y_31945 [Thermoguttaceae bacterium]
MNETSSSSFRFGQWLAVVVFAVAMAWVESSVVLYLRSLSGQFDPYQPARVPLDANILRAEMVREAATLVMLASAGWLAGQTWRSRAALAIVAFGTWDIFYYVFLVPLTGWPRSLLDWDILFLLPLPWWGPVIAPVLIASLMIAGGSLVALRDSAERPAWPGWFASLLALAGGVLGLYVFMEDALRVLPQGAEKLMDLRPQHFDWPVFLVALALMSAPVIQLARRPARFPAP